jgi:hypothetical protein
MPKAHDDFKKTLKLLKEYEKKDPNNKKAIKDFAEGEASGEDPLKCKMVEKRFNP